MIPSLAIGSTTGSMIMIWVVLEMLHFMMYQTVIHYRGMVPKSFAPMRSDKSEKYHSSTFDSRHNYAHSITFVPVYMGL